MSVLCDPLYHIQYCIHTTVGMFNTMARTQDIYHKETKLYDVMKKCLVRRMPLI